MSADYHAKCWPVWWFVRVRSVATVKHNWNLTRRFPLNAGMIEEMNSISQKVTTPAIALVSFLIGGCSDIPQSADDNWTELCKARLDKSMCQADSECLWVEKDDEPSRCHAAQR